MVIIDEAHNLLDVINSVHSVEISGAHVCMCIFTQCSSQVLRALRNLLHTVHMYM